MTEKGYINRKSEAFHSLTKFKFWAKSVAKYNNFQIPLCLYYKKLTYGLSDGDTFFFDVCIRTS